MSPSPRSPRLGHSSEPSAGRASHRITRARGVVGASRSMRCDAMREREGDGVECTRVCSRVAFVAFVVVVVVVDDG